ncbi:MAG: transposase, partial [Janthinobacterium lividum]
MEGLTGPGAGGGGRPRKPAAIVRESLEPGKTVSMVARRSGVDPDRLSGKMSTSSVRLAPRSRNRGEVR